MEKFQLSVLLKIKGIGSASGLLYHKDKLYIISDNSTFLYEYSLTEEKLNKIALVENPQDNLSKKDKFDFEVITLHNNELHIFGSGSTENRNFKFIYDTTSTTVVIEDLKSLYQNIKSNLNITDEELNIEGAFFGNEKLYLFQRGNGANSKNGVIILDKTIEFIPIVLPKIKHVEATFTDAILIENKIYFLAAAEDTTSTYEDGEVLGSIIGCIDFKTLKLDFTYQISNKNKIEGLTLHKKTATHIELLLCEDNDTDILDTDIYSLVLKR